MWGRAKLQRIENKSVPLDWRVEAMKLTKDRARVEKLEKELAEIKDGGKRERFRAGLVSHGAEESDLDDIEQFMVDNEYGPKAAKAAVRRGLDGTTSARMNTLYPDMIMDVYPAGGKSYCAAAAAPNARPIVIASSTGIFPPPLFRRSQRSSPERSSMVRNAVACPPR